MITFVPTPIGNPQDITIRAMSAFEQAEIFLCEDTRETKRLLNLLAERFGMKYPDAQLYSFHEHNGEQRLGELADILETKEIVYVSDAGMPAISDPGALLVKYAQERSIEYDILPGASAVTTVYAASGFDGGEFLFFGFLPHKAKERLSKLDEVLGCGYDAILYESPHRLEKLLSEITSIDPDREIFVAKEISKKFQRYYFGDAGSLFGQITSDTIRGEWALVIKGEKKETKGLSEDEILRLDIPPKIKAKLLSKITDKTTKEWYEQLVRN